MLECNNMLERNVGVYFDLIEIDNYFMLLAGRVHSRLRADLDRQNAFIQSFHISRRISKLQKKAIRFLTNSKFNSHTAPLFNQLKAVDIFKLACFKLLYKSENSKFRFISMACLCYK